MQRKIPNQLTLLRFSLNKSTPNILELTMMPILTRGKTTELSRSVFANACKKKTNEKKFGIPKTNPHITFFNLKGFLCFLLNDFRK